MKKMAMRETAFLVNMVYLKPTPIFYGSTSEEGIVVIQGECNAVFCHMFSWLPGKVGNFEQGTTLLYVRTYCTSPYSVLRTVSLFSTLEEKRRNSRNR